MPGELIANRMLYKESWWRGETVLCCCGLRPKLRGVKLTGGVSRWRWFWSEVKLLKMTEFKISYLIAKVDFNKKPTCGIGDGG